MTTLTPEMLLHIAQVRACGDQVVVQEISGGASAASFGGPVDEDEELAEATYEWSDVLSGDWRLVTAH